MDLAACRDDIGMVRVEPRNGTQAVRAEKLVLRRASSPAHGAVWFRSRSRRVAARQRLSFADHESKCRAPGGLRETTGTALESAGACRTAPPRGRWRHTAATAPPWTGPSDAAPGRREDGARHRKSHPPHPTFRCHHPSCPWPKRSTSSAR